MSPADRWPDQDAEEREFTRDLAEPLAAVAARTAACPPFGQLLAAHDGILPEREQRAVAAHVAACALCRALASDALACDMDVTEGDLARLRGRVGARYEPPAHTGRASTPRTMVLALAASLAAVVALGTWAVSLRQENQALRNTAVATGAGERGLVAGGARIQELEAQLARLREPAVTLNVPLVDLEPVDALRGVTPPAISLSRRVASVSLVLAIAGTPNRDGYSLEVRDQTGRVVWTGSGLTATPAGIVSLVVPRTLLPPGDLTLRLSTTGAPVHQYVIRVTETP